MIRKKKRRKKRAEVITYEIVHHDQVEFILGMQRQFNIHKTVWHRVLIKQRVKGDLIQQMEKNTPSHGKNKPTETWERLSRRMKAMYGKPVQKGDWQVHSPHFSP